MKHIKRYSDTKVGITDRIDLYQAVNRILDEKLLRAGNVYSMKTSWLYIIWS